MSTNAKPPVPPNEVDPADADERATIQDEVLNSAAPRAPTTDAKGRAAHGAAEAPRVIVLAWKSANSWPKPQNKVRVLLRTLEEVLRTTWRTDVHFQPIATTTARRLNNDAVGHVLMAICALIGDLDDPVAHRTKTPARPEWRHEQERKLRKLRERHPGVFIYPTNGGYRIVFALARPFTIGSTDDRFAWWGAYLAFARYVRLEFGLRLDTKCKDFGHLYRAPRVLRDGVPQQPATIGDPANLERLDLREIMAKYANPKLHPYVRAALRKAVEAVRTAADGAKNETLNREAYALAGFIPGGYLDETELADALLDAILKNGGDDAKDAKKIAEAIEKGKAQPREPPPARTSGKGASSSPSGTAGTQPAPAGGGAASEDAAEAAPATTLSRGDHVDLAIHLVQRIQNGGVEPVDNEGDLYRYNRDSGLWIVVREDEQSKIVQSFAGRPIMGNGGKPPRPLKLRAVDVCGTIKLAGHRVAHPLFFAEAPHGLAFANGFVTVTADGVHRSEHSPDHRCRLGYDFDYIANASPKMFLKCLDDTWRDDSDKAQKIDFTQEFGGIAMIGKGPKFSRAFTALGKGGRKNGNNAKSTLARLLAGVMPKGSTTSVPPQMFEDEYRRAKLAGKLLNFVGELPERDILESEAFKAIMTGDETDARQPYGRAFDFASRASHYYSANALPGSKDLTEAFFRRWMLVTFNRTFTPGTPDHDPNIAEKILAAEPSQMASWFLDGAVRALRNGTYTIPESHNDEMREWKRNADQVALFVEEATSAAKSIRPHMSEPHDWTRAGALYDAYALWVIRSGHRTLAKNKFGARMKDLGSPSVHTNLGDFYPVRLV